MTTTFSPNALDITSVQAVERVFINPQSDTDNLSVYEALILNGYTGDKPDQVMTFANAVKSTFDQEADKVVKSVTEDTPPQQQDFEKRTINGVEFGFAISA